jgi:OOP family OmpA-OmpF porin
MLRLLLAFIISCTFALHSKAQNLVPNPSFEEYSDCPTGVPDLEGKCNNWTSFRGSPDYFNNCSSNIGFNNPFGYQAARNGQAYVGLGNFQITIPNLREQIGVELKNPLEIGIKYYLIFYVSSAYTHLLVNIATNKIGAAFTTYQYDDPNLDYPLPNNCQVFTNTIITDTLNWIKISSSFVADSAYKYLTIGGFFDDQHIDTIHFPYQVVPQASYYYLDDVCVTTDSAFAENWTSNYNGIGNLLNGVKLFPNPSSGLILIESGIAMESIAISNSIGESILNQGIISKDLLKLNLSLPKGVYYATIVLQNKHHVFKKIVINY